MAKELMDFKEFRKSLATSQRYERFRYMLIEWDLAQVRYLLYLHPRPVEKAQVEVMMIGMNCRINVSHALGKDIDLTAPLYAVHLALPGTALDGSLLLLDGHHRVYRASSEAVKTLPCFVLTRDEEVRCRTRNSMMPHEEARRTRK